MVQPLNFQIEKIAATATEITVLLEKEKTVHTKAKKKIRVKELLLL